MKVLKTPEDLNAVVQCTGCGILNLWSLDPAHFKVGGLVEADEECSGAYGLEHGCGVRCDVQVLVLVPSANYA